MVNHFYKNGFITSKVGLTQSLKRLPLWNNDVDMECFYPRCYCVHRNDIVCKKYKQECENADPTYEWDHFSEYFRIVFAESLLKHFIEDRKFLPVEKALIVLKIADRRLISFEERMDRYGIVQDTPPISEIEW